ncbi:MAG: hypothetical protein OXI25_04150 [Chloroflexota bacterium]|nr:hypothetical protein [Chloroflexota bacterium]
MIARRLEEAGLPTVNIALVREHAERVKPPRALAVPFPFGMAFGRPNDADLQRRVLRQALALLPIAETPVLAAWPEEETGSVELLQASHVEREAPADADAADEPARLRPYYERWLEDNGGRTAVGLSRVPARRLRALVRFLQACERGDEAADMEERPSEMPAAQFIRYAVDDLKAFYYEARMAQRPSDDRAELHRWFWGRTAGGRLVAALAERLNASDDPGERAIAFGLAR